MGYKAEILRFPDQHFSILTTCNLGSINPGPLAEQVADVYLGAKMGTKPERQVAARRGQRDVALAAELSPAELAVYTGDYYSDEVDATYHVAVENGALVLSARHVPSQKLSSTAPDVFRAENGVTLRFVRVGADKPSAFTIEAGRVRNIRFVRRS
jgi:hypothetical protein